MTTRLPSPAALVDLVGQELGRSDWHELTQDQVNLFAEATGDHQWIHVDPVRAVAGPFGTTIAHGYLTLSLVPVFLDEIVTIDAVTAVVNYGLNKVRFPAPVPVGGKVRASLSVAAAAPRGAALEVTYNLVIEVAGSERPACIAAVVVLYS